MIVVFLLGTALLLLLFEWSYAGRWYRSLSVRVLFSQPHICARENVELSEVIENRKKLAVPLVEIGFRIPQGLRFEDAENTLESDYVYKRDIFAVAGMERIVRRYRMTALKRGFYSVSQLNCHAPSRLFHKTYMMDRMVQEEEAGLFVYAARADCSLLLRAVCVVLGEKESTHRMYEDPFVFSSIRPYTIQDPMKTVNWKATAKTGQLMVNTYASTTQLRVRIFLDVSADPLLPFSDTFRESAIAIAASLIRALVKDRMDACLLVNCLRPSGDSDLALRDYVLLPSCAGAGKMTAMEEFLTTDFASSALLPYEEMLRREAVKSLSPAGGDEVFVFLTSSDTPSLRRNIQTLLGNSRSGILAVLSRTAEHRREEQEKNLHIMPVYEIG